MNTNEYRQFFNLPCVNNGEVIAYELTLTTYGSHVIMVEELQHEVREVCPKLAKPYHETIADHLYDRFGGYQVIKAHHHGTHIETIRGEYPSE